MKRTIAVAGKGGTGKTTFAALTIRYLQEQGEIPILAIDADPSANLNMALGLPLAETVGQIREETLEEVSGGTFRPGIAKADWFQYRIMECLIEGDALDLLAMGRPEGPGCYCAANHMLRLAIDRLADQYQSVVIDNEAGMEHISRQTTRDVDYLFVVSDPTVRGLTAAERIVELVQSLGNRVAWIGLVMNRVVGALPDALQDRIERLNIPQVGTLPEDPAVSHYDAEGRPLFALASSSPVVVAVDTLLASSLA